MNHTPWELYLTPGRHQTDGTSPGKQPVRVNVCEQLGRVAGINDAVIGGSLLQQLHTRWIRGIYNSVSAQFFSGVKPILMLSQSGDIGAVRPRCLSRKLTDGPQPCHPHILARLNAEALNMPHANARDAQEGTKFVFNVIRELNTKERLRKVPPQRLKRAIQRGWR